MGTGIKTISKLKEQLKKDYNTFLKGHSKHPDDVIYYSDWLSEILPKTEQYGWKFFTNDDYELVALKLPVDYDNYLEHYI